jgi:type IV pilus assembly protein PilA
MADRANGFTLIELVIVIAIILVIAAIAIPNLLRSRIAANEAAAVGSIHTINVAANTYYATYNSGYPRNLTQLGTTGSKAASCKNAQLIDSVLTAGTKSGYDFVLRPGTQKISSGQVPKGCTAGYSDGYVVTATPVTVGITGQRAFCSDVSNVVRFNDKGKAKFTRPYCSATMSPLQ